MNMAKKNTIINEVYITLEGDKSVGINPQMITISDFHYDLGTGALNDKEAQKMAEDVRKILSKAFLKLFDDRLSVTFDYECK